MDDTRSATDHSCRARRGTTKAQQDSLVAKGRAAHKTRGPAAMTQAHSALKAASTTIETTAFTSILAASGKMSLADEKWLEHPLLEHPLASLKEALSWPCPEVKMRAIRAMACESVGRILDEKEWLKMDALPEWLTLQKSFVHMGAVLAGKLCTQIFRILAEGQL